MIFFDREHRENLSKGARTKCNETKESLRKVQSKYVKLLKDKELVGMEVSKVYFLTFTIQNQDYFREYIGPEISLFFTKRPPAQHHRSFRIRG